MTVSGNLTFDKKIILCADDYSQNMAISEGILLLLRKNRINAVSCMVNTPFWNEISKELARESKHIFVGLHFNLTLGRPVSSQWHRIYGEQFTDLLSLLRKSYLGRLKNYTVLAEIQAQLDMFTDTLGRYPDFIDGHQHIHQLPIIREALLRKEFYSKKNIFYRSTYNNYADFLSLNGFPKQQLLPLLGGIAFKRKMKQHAIASNSHFAGIYNFRRARNYRKYFKHFLKSTNNNGLIMCHPGLESINTEDHLAYSRWQELTYLMSDFYLNDMKDSRCQLMSYTS